MTETNGVSGNNDVRFTYVRNRRNQKVGVIAHQVEGTVLMAGWSMCSGKHGDVFDREAGKNIAVVRLIERPLIARNVAEGNQAIRTALYRILSSETANTPHTVRSFAQAQLKNHV